MSRRPYPKYATRDAHAGPLTTCSTCGFLWNQSDMSFQYNFQGGSVPMNTQILRCARCIDDLQYQAKLIIIPPDPPPFFNTRPENYYVDETNWLTTDANSILTTDDGTEFITSNPNPASNPATTKLITRLLYPGGTLISAYLDLFAGDPKGSGVSILSAVTGSNVRANIVPVLTIANGIAENTATYSVTSASGATVNISFAALFDSASGGALLVSGSVGANPSITAGQGVVFDALALSINLNT